MVARRGAAVFLSLLFVVNVYRAATQSVVCDEAYSWQLYLSHPISAVFREFTAANHFLATLFAWISFHSLPWPVFAMRLPTVLAGGWYFINVYRLCVRVFPDPIRFLLGIGLLTLNPLILDCLICARGYGLALAGLSYALLAMVNRDALRAGLGLAFGIATSLVFLTPAVALGAVFLTLCFREKAGSPIALTTRLAGPVLVSLLILYFVFPLHLATRGAFYWGVNTWTASLLNLIGATFTHDLYIGMLNPPSIGYRIWLGFLTALTVGVAALLLARLIRPKMRPDPVFVLSAGGILLSAAALLAAHLIWNVLYPVDRLGVYFLMLTPLAVLSGLPRIGPALGFIALASFLWQFETTFFYVWRYDADTEQIATFLNDRAAKDQRVVRLGISWPLEPAINFCRVVKGHRWLAAVDRSGPDGNYDYYVITPPMGDIRVDDEAVMQTRKLVVLYEGAVSGTRVAAKQ